MMSHDNDTVSASFYRRILASLTEGEELLWHGRPELKCYQRYMRGEYIKVLIFLSAIVLVGLLIDVLLDPHDPARKGIAIQLVLLELVSIWLMGYFILCPKKVVDQHYAVTSTHMIYTSWNQSHITGAKIAWKRIKAIKVRSESCDLMTITIKPYFWSGHNIYDFRCIAEGNEVLALITAHRPDLYSDQWFS